MIGDPEDGSTTTGQSEGEPSGHFNLQSREAATRRALPLLATYFAAAPSWTLSLQPQVGTADLELDELSSFVRLRVALAAAREFDSLLRQLEGRASFQYARVAEDSIGVLRGQLDTSRYMRTRLRPESPRRYPVQIIHRRYATPENALAAYGTLWLVRELVQAPVHLIPPEAPERREILERQAALARVLRQPILAQASEIARDVRRRRALATLLDSVEARIEGGYIAASDTYRSVVGWMRRFDPERAAPVPGVVEWAFYDDRFDTKLFEIWSLSLLIDALEARLGPPTSGVRPLYERSGRPLCVWNLGAARILVLFQAGLSRLGVGDVRWRFAEPQAAPLGGIPDLAIVVDRVGAGRALILVDPKLRERSRAPTEEIYKLLGYFGNLPGSLRPLAAIVFYSPGVPRAYRLNDDKEGQLFAIGVDPADEPSAAILFQRLGELVVSASSLSEKTVARLRGATSLSGDEQEESIAATRQDAAAEAMLLAAQSLPAGSLSPVRKTTAANLREIWELLGEDTATMIVTAEYFGQNAPADADHSGPLLGLAAACERVLYDVLFEEVLKTYAHLFEESQTLGTLIRALWDALRPSPRYADGQAVATYLGELGPDTLRLRQIAGDLRKLNVEYRIPAAHREVVSQGLWVAGRSFILTPHLGLLPRMLLAFSRER